MWKLPWCSPTKSMILSMDANNSSLNFSTDLCDQGGGVPWHKSSIPSQEGGFPVATPLRNGVVVGKRGTEAFQRLLRGKGFTLYSF